MGRHLILLWRCTLLALIALPALAEDASHPVTLWQIDGARNSVFLLGSIHLLRSEDYPLPSAFDAAYQEAEVIIMEIDMDDLDPLASQAAMNEYGVIHDDSNLRSLMGNDLYAQAEAAATAIDIPLDMLDKSEPWYAAMTVEMMMLNRMGFNPMLGVEMYIMAAASEDGKRIDGLETIEEQLQFLDGMSLQAQRDMLLSVLVDSAKLEHEMDALVTAWRNGDTETLAASMLEDFAGQEELNKTLLTDRNARWIEKIKVLLDDDDDYLIVVGALHLIGPDGVPRQIENSGYDIRQLSELAPAR